MWHPVCVKCKKVMKPEKNGVYFVETASLGPYKIWMADKFRCPSCGYEVLAGYGNAPVKEHYQPGFKETLDKILANEEVIVERQKNDE